MSQKKKELGSEDRSARFNYVYLHEDFKKIIIYMYIFHLHVLYIHIHHSIHLYSVHTLYPVYLRTGLMPVPQPTVGARARSEHHRLNHKIPCCP
jgi:hypothetical protein